MPLSDLTHHSIMPLTTTISCCACSACPPPRRGYGTYRRRLTVAAITDQIKARRPPAGIVRRFVRGYFQQLISSQANSASYFSWDGK